MNMADGQPENVMPLPTLSVAKAQLSFGGPSEWLVMLPFVTTGSGTESAEDQVQNRPIHVK